MKTGIIVQARTGSSRLPNKVILPFWEEKSILDILLKNLTVLQSQHPIILATSKTDSDKVLGEYAHRYNCFFFQGDEHNVLNRFTEAAVKYNLDSVIRICADNPFFSIKSLQDLVSIYHNEPNIDYCSFKNNDGIPSIKTHIGIFGEIISLNALLKIQNLTSDVGHLEHVTSFIYTNPALFNIHLEKAPKNVFSRNDLRFTIDDKIDFNNLIRVYQEFKQENYDNFDQVIAYVDSNPDIKREMLENIKKYSK